MMPAINAAMLALSSSLAASIVAKVTITTVLALIATRLACRTRAAVRHTLLAAAFGVLLVLPIASIVAPPVRITLPAATQQRTAPPRPTPTISPAASALPGAAVPSAAPPSPALSPSALLLAAWTAGAALFLVPVAIGLWQVRSLRRSALPWRHGQSVAAILALDAGIHRAVEVLVHDTLPGPMTCGVLHLAILLPRDAQTWDAGDLHRAIVHELEHIRRRDWVSHCFARAVSGLYWFHPLVWIAWRRFALEAERSCDDAVLARSDAAAYADQLVGLAQRLSTAAKSPLLAMANRADLSTRVRAVLDSRQSRGRAGTIPIALACAAAAALVLGVSPLTMVAAPQATDDTAAPAAQFTADSLLVIATVTVSDRNGKTTEGLAASDFALTEDGVPQTIGIFEFQQVAAGPVQSYYILGYYTANRDADDKFRAIQITGKLDTMAKLDYRAGYYTRGAGSGGAVSATGIDRTTPAVLYKREPEYSDAARRAKYQGTVILNVNVDANGTVTKIITRRALGLGLDEKAIDAVSQWKFRPAMKDGKPVPSQAQVDVNFRLL